MMRDPIGLRLDLLQSRHTTVSDQITFIQYSHLLQRRHNALPQLHEMFDSDDPDQFIGIIKQTLPYLKHTAVVPGDLVQGIRSLPAEVVSPSASIAICEKFFSSETRMALSILV